MSKKVTFFGERLKRARQFRGLTLTDLALKTGISKQSLSLYENGTNFPDLEKILSLSQQLGFPYLHFFVQDTYQVRTEATYFRSLLSVKKKERTAQSMKLEFAAQIFEVLCEYIDFRPLNLPHVDFDGGNEGYTYENENEATEIEEITKNLRDYWKTGCDSITDLKYLLELNGILVMCLDSNTDKIDAFSQKTVINNGDIFIIAISKTGQSIARSRFDMAHELGHILLHPWSEDLETISKEEFKARERQANLFASSFLLPKESFGIDVAHYPTNLEYYEFLKTKWNVSIQAMIYRTHQLGIISSNQYQYLMRQISKKGWRDQEPNDKAYLVTDNLLESAVSLLINENELTGEAFVDRLKSQGIVMREEEIEELLSLKPGTLTSKEKEPAVLLQLKGSFNEDSLN